MTQIINGELVYNETTQNANGGTELMARRMVRDIPQELLAGKQIVHSRVRELDPNLKKILVCHDLAHDPEVRQLADAEYRKQFEKIVFVSNWQQHMYNLVLGVPFSESVVIKNGIEVEPYTPKAEDGPIRLIYHTTPHRGLELLYIAFEAAAKHFDIHLDVFSSFKAYGWEQRDEPYKPLFETMENHPNITMHGFQPNDVIREHLKKSHLFAYPNIWPETSCLALIEALCFGNFVLHSNLGALPETASGLTTPYMFNEDVNTHVNVFYRNLMEALHWISNNRGDVNHRLEWIAQAAKNQFNWDLIRNDWVRLLKDI